MMGREKYIAGDFLYARYDGPLPRPADPTTARFCWEAMLRDCLYMIRCKRKTLSAAAAETALHSYVQRARQIRRFLMM